MKILIIDTSTIYLIISFVVDNQVIYQKVETGKNNHSDNLLTYFTEGLELHNLKARDFDKIIVGIGPGAYTGLRVSLTVCKVLAWTLEIPLYTVSSFDLLMSGYLEINGKYALNFKAKKDYCYGKIIEIKNQKIIVLEDEGFFSEEVFLAKVQNDSNVQIITHDLIRYDALNVLKEKLVKVTNIHTLEPNYLRVDFK